MFANAVKDEFAGVVWVIEAVEDGFGHMLADAGGLHVNGPDVAVCLDGALNEFEVGDFIERDGFVGFEFEQAPVELLFHAQGIVIDFINEVVHGVFQRRLEAEAQQHPDENHAHATHQQADEVVSDDGVFQDGWRVVVEGLSIHRIAFCLSLGVALLYDSR